ncbi:tetratricopeptide repeat protein [Gilvibacter sediminis]|uniref:tetratricopeptide repeat protein n=1 Tax=Gilvibacter sediminis TaxID=379071 RepID=UPI002350B2F5|nr:hypothetical protein [Gilvibacter sediminis]MDC7999153.1 hypothetical protein [Gilvibacter sediminis]
MKKPFVFLLIALLFIHLGQAQSKVDSLKTALSQTADPQIRLTVLDELTTALIRNNDSAQEQYLKEYLALAGDLKEFDSMASKSRFLIQFYINTRRIEKAQRLADSLLTFKDRFNNESSEAHLKLKRAALFYDQNRFEEALQDYDRSATLFLSSGDSIFAADAYFFSGQALSDQNNFLEAIKKFETAEQLYERLGDVQYSILVGAELTQLYKKNGFVQKSINERERLLKKALANEDYLSYLQLLGQNVVAYHSLKNYEQMDATLQLMDEAGAKFDDPYSKSYYDRFKTNYKLLGACYRGDLEQATVFMDQLEAIEAEGTTPYLQGDALTAKAAYFELVGNQASLIKTLQELADINGTNRLEAQIEAREKLAAMYSAKGQYNKVVDLLRKNARIKDSIYEIQRSNTFLYYQAAFENEKRLSELSQQDAQIKLLESDKQLAANKRNSLIALLTLIFLAVGLIIYFRNRQKIKEQAYQNILLNNKIANKTEEINTLLNETIQHIKSKERIAENLQKLSNENEGITLKSIIADLKASKADNTKLMLIKQNIEQVNFEFIKKLKTTHPELTKTDVEICSLIRIGLNRKEVANLRNTSLEAVKSSRFRIKKKLGLSPDSSLDDYINTL